MKRKKLSLILTLFLAINITYNASAAETAPKIYAKSAITIDAATGEIIYASNADSKMNPASTTKLMTSLLLAEKFKPEDNLTYTKLAKDQVGVALNRTFYPINVGQKISADDVMESLLLYSANDIAYVVAGNVADNALEDKDGSKFSTLMNEKAKKLGMTSTHFENPVGLDDYTNDHYTTAYDLSTLAKAAFSNEWISKVTKEPNAEVTIAGNPTFKLENRNKLLLKAQPVYDITCIGGKTGYTEKSGKCLVAIFDRDGRKVIGVVMKSIWDQDDLAVFKDMEAVVNYSYSQERQYFVDTDKTKKETPYKSGTIVTTVKVKYKAYRFFGPEKSIDVPLKLNGDIKYYSNEINDKNEKPTFAISNINPWKIKTDTNVGTVTYKQRNLSNKCSLTPTISSSELVKENMLLYVFSGLGLIAFIGVLIALISKLKKITKRR